MRIMLKHVKHNLNMISTLQNELDTAVLQCVVIVLHGLC